MEDTNKTLGKKLKNFRLRTGISQLELENQVGLALGSLSRIESGQINPTKETLVKLINALNLQSYEATDLFSISISNQLAKLLEVTKDLSTKYDIDDILQSSADQIAKELNLLGVGIFKVIDGKAHAYTFTKTWYTDIVMKAIPVPLNSIWLSLKDDTESLVVQSINAKKPMYTEREADLLKPKMESLWDLLQKIIGLKSMIVYPLIYGNEPLGAVVFAKNYIDNFENEKAILQQFTEHISVCIANAQKYNELLLNAKKPK